MKYIKHFEDEEEFIEYSVGDIVTCKLGSDDITQGRFTVNVKYGEKYLVLRIYDILEREVNSYTKDRKLFVDVKDIKTGQLTDGWTANRFWIELNHAVNKYNL